MTALSDKPVEVNWDLINKHGVCVTVRSHMWGGRKKLDPSDIGLQFTSTEWDEISGKFSLGVKYLVDPVELQAMKAVILKARNAPLKYGVAFGDLVGVTFVPNGAYDAMKADLDILTAEFYDLKKKFLTEYDAKQEQWLISYGTYARDVLFKLLPTNPEVHTEPLTSAEFADNFIKRLKLFIPSASDLTIKFSLIWNTFELGNPSEVIGDNGAQYSARNKIVRDMKEQMDGQINNFMDGLFDSVRAELLEVVQNSLEVVENSTRFGSKTVNAVLEKVQKLKGLNFYDDQTLTESLERLENACKSESQGVAKDEFKKLFKDSLSSVTQEIHKSQNAKKSVLSNFKKGGRKFS